MSVCDRIHVVLYRRGELPESARITLERHLRSCDRCRAAALEVERFEDLYLGWDAPEPPADLARSVLEVIRGGGREADCTEFAGSVHHFVSRDLEPWHEGAMKRHARSCPACRELLDEARAARRTWLEWEAPPPPRNIARRVAAQVRSQTADSPRHVSLRDWVLGELAMPRLAAAVLVLAASLSLISLWQTLRTPDSAFPAAEPPSVARNLSAEASPPVTRSAAREDAVPSLRLVGFYGSGAGTFDVTNGFSSRFVPELGRLLRTARE